MKLAESIKLYEGGKLEGFGPLGLEGKDPSQAGEVFNKFISSVVGIITVIAFIWFVIKMVTGAFSYMTAGGDKQKLETATKNLTTGIVGVVLVIAAIFIIDLIGELLGIPDILNPAELIQKISP